MKQIFKVLIPLVIIGLILVVYFNYPKLNIITGFAAKNVCSCVFEAGRDPETLIPGDNDFEPVSYAKSDIDYSGRSVTSTVFGLKARTAVYNGGYGCTLLPEKSVSISLPYAQPQRTKSKTNLPYPYGNMPARDTVFPGIDYTKLEQAVANSFDNEEEILKRTRAVVILYKDHLIAEKYGEGFNKDTKLLGWSMTKSITGTILGVLEREARINIDQKRLFSEWENDEREGISLNHLLQMSSSLEWEEDYSKISDVTKMLFLAEDMSVSQLYKPLIGAPGEIWNYSSGTSNLLSGFIRNQFSTHQEYLDYWYTALIDKIGMTSMVLEADIAGNYVGSSYTWATARDWAKFGQLYLRRGNWNGEQILNESWVDYAATPVTGSNGEYGAHFWLNAGGKYPGVPRDMFSANGFQGQHVFIIPSRDIVVVRFGLAEHPDFNVDTFLQEVLQALNLAENKEKREEKRDKKVLNLGL
ncbi:serine hydrolase [soil metagenome]